MKDFILMVVCGFLVCALLDHLGIPRDWWLIALLVGAIFIPRDLYRWWSTAREKA